MSEPKKVATASKGTRKKSTKPRKSEVEMPAELENQTEMGTSPSKVTFMESEISNSEIQLSESDKADSPSTGNERVSDAVPNEERAEQTVSSMAKAPRDPRPPVRATEVDDYLFQIHFDKAAKRFHGSVYEVPEVKFHAETRERVTEELRTRLGNHLQNVRKRGDVVAEPLSLRSYPEKLETPISQNLYRKLDQFSRMERISLDTLVSEILASGLEKRLENLRAKDRRPAQPQQNAPRHQNHNNHNNHNSHSHGNSNSGNSGNSNRKNRQAHNYHDTMSSRENFLEYVRNLEKNGYRKK